MSQKEIEEKIEQTVTAVGAMSEFLGLLMKNLENSGFTRTEALVLCGQAMTIMLGQGAKGGEDER